MTTECCCCDQVRPVHSRGLCKRCYKRHQWAGTLAQYGWVRADRLAEFGELRDRGYPVMVAGARVGVSARTAWRYEAERSAGWPVSRKEAAMSGDPFWNCPHHQAELVYLEERNADPDDWQEHWSCPVEGCTYERHIS